MEKKFIPVILGLTLSLVGGGLIGGNWLTQAQVEDKSNSSTEVIGMLGHVTYVLTDGTGKIKEYRQTDNTVVNTGKNCVQKMLFLGAGATTSGSCGSSVTTGAWKVIAIGNATTSFTPSTDTSNYTLASSSGTRQIVEGLSANTMGRQTAVVDTGFSAGSNATGTSGHAVAVLKATFGSITGIRTGGLFVVSAGIFNSTTPSATGMLAIQPITPINVNNGDSLTITWTVTTG